MSMRMHRKIIFGWFVHRDSSNTSCIRLGTINRISGMSQIYHGDEPKPLKTTRRMREIVRFLKRTSGTIIVETDGESNIVEITIQGSREIDGKLFGNGEVFGSCTEYMIDKLLASDLIIESNAFANSVKGEGYHGDTTWYVAKIKETDK